MAVVPAATRRTRFWKRQNECRFQPNDLLPSEDKKRRIKCD